MKKLLKIVATLTLAATLVVAGVLAATTASHTTTFTVQYNSKDAAVRIDAYLLSGTGTLTQVATQTTYTYNKGTTDLEGTTKATSAETWETPNLNFTDIEKYTLLLKFTNNGAHAVTISPTVKRGDGDLVDFLSPAWYTGTLGNAISYATELSSGAASDATALAGRGVGVVYCAYEITYTGTSDSINNIVETFSGKDAPSVAFSITTEDVA